MRCHSVRVSLSSEKHNCWHGWAHTKISAVHVKGTVFYCEVFIRCLGLNKCADDRCFFLHEYKCGVLRSIVGNCLAKGKQRCKEVIICAGSAPASKRTDFVPTNDSYKVRNKHGGCVKLWQLYQVIYLPTSGQFAIWHMHFRCILEPCRFQAQISFFWQIALSKKARFAFILSHGDSSSLCVGTNWSPTSSSKPFVTDDWVNRVVLMNILIAALPFWTFGFWLFSRLSPLV